MPHLDRRKLILGAAATAAAAGIPGLANSQSKEGEELIKKMDRILYGDGRNPAETKLLLTKLLGLSAPSLSK